MVERFNGDPVAQRWEEEVGERIEYPNADPDTGWPEMLEEVWSL
jgi:L-rhamnose mutarotase